MDKIKEILTRGVEKIIDKKSLEKKLRSKKKLRIKHGIDPTGPKIHIGRATQYLKLKAFQELGHKIVLIIGDFTAQIGDASDKQAMRKCLTSKEIKANMKTYLEQINRILDIKKTEIRYNSEWLDKLSAQDILKLSMNFTAQQMIHRRNFKERWDSQKPVGLHELYYPLLQGYDSVAVKADIELGGSDQLFNLKIGREMQRIFKQNPQDIIALKMLMGLDNRKMSTSWGNVVNILDNPKDMYGKIMSMQDKLMKDYFELATAIPFNEIKKINKLHPKQRKSILAKEIVRIYHSKKDADSAAKEFERVFKEKKLPADIPNIKISKNKINILDLLLKTKLASSKGKARRLIIQGGVKIDSKVEKDWQKEIEIKRDMIVQAGKRRFVRVI